MVTVSNILNNKGLNSVATGATVNTKSYIDNNFQSQNKQKVKTEPPHYTEDTLLDNTFANRLKINVSKTLDIPLVHFPRGLGGAPDYTFYEFLQTAKFPYYVGGPVLAALFYSGVKNDNLKSAAAARKVAKHMALGVALYYLGAAVAKSVINNTVKLARGIDLKHPYAKAVSTTTNQTGVFKKDVEFHTAYESIDFTRTDLLYSKGNTPAEINARYAQIGKKYGLDPNANDIDQTVKPLIKKTITMARAWQYALTALYVTLGIGMANQSAWDNEALQGFGKTVRNGIFGKKVPMEERIHNAKIAAYDNLIKPFGQSFVQFWKGNGSKSSSVAGKSVIITTAAATLTAVSLLLAKTSGRNMKFESSGANNFNEEQK